MPRVLVSVIEMINRPERWSRILTEAGLEIVLRPAEISLHEPARLIEHLVGIDAIIAGLEPLGREVLEASQLRAIARYGVGYDAVDVPAATARGIALAITPGVNHVAVAEHALALILAVFRNVVERDAVVRDGSWRRSYLPRLAGKTLGLIGLGRIARAVAPRAQAFDVRVVAFDPAPDHAFAEAQGVRLVGLDELLAESDIVSLHLPCTAATARLIRRETLAQMRPGAVLINTARGGLVDEEALADALESGRLAGAGLDAFVVEPLPTTSRLLRFNNVVFSPHIAGQDLLSIDAMGCLAAECLAKLWRGEPLAPGCLVNPEIGAGWRW